LKRLFAEAAIGNKSRKMALILSDCEDDAEKHEAITLPSDVICVFVGHVDQKAIETLSERPVIFEGLDSAIQFIKHLATGGLQ
jgi:hypothetical protein